MSCSMLFGTNALRYLAQLENLNHFTLKLKVSHNSDPDVFQAQARQATWLERRSRFIQIVSTPFRSFQL